MKGIYIYIKRERESKKERERERMREGERERERGMENCPELLFLFLKGMMGASALFSYIRFIAPEDCHIISSFFSKPKWRKRKRNEKLRNRMCKCILILERRK